MTTNDIINDIDTILCMIQSNSAEVQQVCIRKLQELKQTIKNNNWIYVSDRLPEPYIQVFVAKQDGTVEIDMYDDILKCWNNNDMNNIIAWQAFPTYMW